MRRNLLFLSIISIASFLFLGLFSRNELMAKEEFTTTTSTTMEHDKKEDKLTSLWKKFQIATAKDLPEEQLSLLDEILQEADNEKFAWDYYDAARKKQEVTLRKNWKLKKEANENFQKLIEEADLPIISFLYQLEYGKESLAQEMVRKEVIQLKEGYHPSVYQHSGRLDHCLNGQLAHHIKDDYEYCLWVLTNCHFSEWNKELENYLGNRYPARSWLDLMTIDKNYPAYQFPTERKTALKKLIENYPGKAISLYAREKLIYLQLNALKKETVEVEEDYQRLYDDCKKLISDRKKLSSSEKRLYGEPKQIQSLLKEWKAPALRIELDEKDSIFIYFRNLESARLYSWKKGEQNQRIFQSEQKIKTLQHPFYIEEKIAIPLPSMDDGTYIFRVENGKTYTECTSTYTTLSLAQRKNNQGVGIYVTDHLTGKPVQRVRLHLIKNGSEIDVLENFPLEEGFTTLPKSWSDQLKKGRHYLYAEYQEENGRIRKSPYLSLYSWNSPETSKEKESFAEIFLGQGAYRPGEILKFKTILYEGDPYKRLHTVPVSTQIFAEILDSEQNKLQEISLETDEFGAAAVSFPLPKDLRNGMFHIQIRLQNQILCQKDFRVDDFVLPEFNVHFLPQEEIYAFGDEICIKGEMASYSGHPVSGTKAIYEIFKYGKLVSEGQLELDESGDFRIRFQSEKQAVPYGTFYSVKLRVVGTTGETHEYETSVYVSGKMNLNTQILNKTESHISLDDSLMSHYEEDDFDDLFLIRDKEIQLHCQSGYRNKEKFDLIYQFTDAKGDTLQSGVFSSEEDFVLNWENQPDGIYRLHLLSDSGKKGIQEEEETLGLIKLSPGAQELDAPIRYLFTPYNTDLSKGNQCGALFGSCSGETWAVAEWYGKNKELLKSQAFHLDGKDLADLTFEFKPNYPEIITLQVFYFKNKKSENFSQEFRRPQKSLELPLSWKSFQDKTTPKTHYSFTLQTQAGVQCLAAIYDKSLEEIQANPWPKIRLRKEYEDPVYIQSICGDMEISQQNSSNLLYPDIRYKFASVAGKQAEDFVMDDCMIETKGNAVEEAGPEDPNEKEVTIRSDFSSTLSFQPFLQSDEKGIIHLDFDTNDQLSTFIVSLFAHDQNMKNQVLRSELMVTVPLKVSVSEPAFLYDGDEWKMKVAITSQLDHDISGTLQIEEFAGTSFKGKRPFKKASTKIRLEARGSETEIFEIVADQQKILRKMKEEDGPTSLGIKIRFLSDDRKVSDGIFFHLPILDANQTITESHSMLWRPGENKKDLYHELAAQFTNGSGSGAEVKETSLLNLVKEALDVHPEGKDVLSYAEALYLQALRQQMGWNETKDNQENMRQLLDKILDCRNQDGGFGWFEGMKSSPIITATLLDRIKKIEALSEEIDLTSSVHYLDNSQFNLYQPYWCGNISLAQYLHIRSQYPEVEFQPEMVGSPKENEKRLVKFKRDLNEYLLPEGNRGLNGQIFAKARRVLTLMNLIEKGTDLVTTWNLGEKQKLVESMQEDVGSLLQYAVKHQEGGWYYPNLVMPFRGLLETEAYAHALMCEVLDRWNEIHPLQRKTEISEGIRLWLMIQKENQKWDEDPGFMDAIHTIMNGSDELKASKILVLTQRYEKPLKDIQASGNGMRIQRKFYRETKDEKGQLLREEISEGDDLKIGDVLLASYQIHNDENRSFGKLTAWREAGLVPTEALSGIYHWSIRPMVYGTIFHYSPMSYRDVRSDRSLFYMDVMPEEDFEIEERFYVTRAGQFQAPAIEIESMYAPHYRANDTSQSEMRIK